jgi:hypothetical protein
MHAKLTEIIGINKVNINLRYPALNAISSTIFFKLRSLFQSDCVKKYCRIPSLSGIWRVCGFFRDQNLGKYGFPCSEFFWFRQKSFPKGFDYRNSYPISLRK